MVLRAAEGAGRARPPGDGVRRLQQGRGDRRGAGALPGPGLRPAALPRSPRRRAAGRSWRRSAGPTRTCSATTSRRDLDAVLARGYDVLHLEQLWGGWLACGTRPGAGERPPPASGSTSKRPRRGLARGRIDERWMIGDRAAARPRVPLLPRRARRGWSRRCSGSTPAAEITYGSRRHGPDPLPVHPRRASGRGARSLSLIGSMGWYPGHSAAVRLLTRLWPEIKRRVPAARAADRRLGARSALKDYLGHARRDDRGERPRHPALLRADRRVALRPQPGQRDEDQDPRGAGVRRSGGHDQRRASRACPPRTACTPASARTTPA